MGVGADNAGCTGVACSWGGPSIEGSYESYTQIGRPGTGGGCDATWDLGSYCWLTHRTGAVRWWLQGQYEVIDDEPHERI